MRSYPRVMTELGGDSVPVRKRGPGKRFLVILTLFLVTVGGLMGYAIWYWNKSREDLVVLNLRIEETRHQQLLLQQQLEASSEQIEEQQALITEQQERLTGQQQIVDRQAEQVTAVVTEIAHVRKEHRALDEAVTDTRQQLSAVPSEMLRSKIEYLLDIAETELRYRNDIDDALALMQKALAILEEKRLYPDVQAVLGEEIAALQAWSKPDEVDIRTRLLAMADRVAELDLKSVAEIRTTSISDPASEEWLAHVRDSLHEIVMQQGHSGLTASHNRYREDILRNELRLAFDDARFALLANDPERYRATLALSARLAQRYFDTDEEFINAIESLATIEFEPALPETGKALQLFNDKHRS
ncbi:MAG: uroporphyrinogen-III C-methyltransferase [Gammaproteobacteria bacterium]